ncbi:adenylate kinase family protein [Candidatus Mycoplasma pogonae]
MIIKNLIFLGAPGAGKGTLASAMTHKVEIQHVSTGEIFREQIRLATPLGIELKNIVESGLYVPDEITNQIVAAKIQALNEAKQHFIFDGYPRTIDQAQFLDHQAVIIDYVVLLEAPREVLVSRLSKRRYCPQCSATYHLDFKPSKTGTTCELDGATLLQRPDDTETAVIKRLEVYEQQTKQLIDYYRHQGKLKVFDATLPVDELVDKVITEVFSG